MEKTISEHAAWFEDFARAKIAACRRDVAPLALKLEHSRHVLRNAATIIEDEKMADGMARICLLGALYHDVSRFDQYISYGTFKDRDSCNHGLLSVKILKAEKRLAGEGAANRRAILTSVALHNRFRLPPHLPPASRLACDVVRAADKLDILRVMDEHLSAPGPYNPTVVLSLPDNPDLSGKRVIEAVMAGKTASYNDLLSVNDFRLLLGSWFFDLSLPSAASLFLRAGHARRLVEALPPLGPHGAARAFLLQKYGEYERKAAPEENNEKTNGAFA